MRQAALEWIYRLLSLNWSSGSGPEGKRKADQEICDDGADCVIAYVPPFDAVGVDVGLQEFECEAE